MGGDGSPRMDDRVTERRIGTREGNPTMGGSPKGVTEESAGCWWRAPPRGVMESQRGPSLVTI